MNKFIILCSLFITVYSHATLRTLECNDFPVSITVSDRTLTEEQVKRFNTIKSIGLSDIDTTLFMVFDSMKNHSQQINAEPTVDDPNRIKILISRIDSILNSTQETALNKNDLKAIRDSFSKIVVSNINDNETMRILNLYSIYKLSVIEARTNLNNKLCGLNDAEIFSVYLYTGGAYKVINSALRGFNNESIQYIALIETINSALEKIKPITVQVSSGSNLPPKTLAEHAVGSKVTYAAYTSASLEQGFTADYKFIINSKNGRYIAPLSIHPDEEEVLFKNNTSFKVDSLSSNIFIMTEQ